MKIVLYTGYQSKHWNTETFLKSGLGGTEQSVLSLAFSLINLGYEVYVVGDVIEGDYQNPKF